MTGMGLIRDHDGVRRVEEKEDEAEAYAAAAETEGTSDTDNVDGGRGGNGEGKRRKFRMVALDLDGTLLGPDHRLSDVAVEHLNRLHSRGFLVSIATGRSVGCTFDVVSRLNLPPSPHPHPPPRGGVKSVVDEPGRQHNICPGMPVVCSNGATGIRLTSTLRVTEVFHEPLERDVALRVLDVGADMGHVVQYYHGRDIYALLPPTPTGGGGEDEDEDARRRRREEGHEWLIAKYSEITGCRQVRCDDDPARRRFRVDMLDAGLLPSKVLLLCLTEELDGLTSAVRDAVGDRATVVRGTPPYFVEILGRDVCKGEGVRRMCRALGVDEDEVVAFGDGDNDVEMIRMAGHGVAMGNARETVKGASDEVCEWTNAEDGVVRTLRRMEDDGLLHFPL